MDRSWEYIIAHRHMNVEIGDEAALFPEKENINRIAVAVQATYSRLAGESIPGFLKHLQIQALFKSDRPSSL